MATEQHGGNTRVFTFTIASGASLSAGVDLLGLTPVGVLLPSANWTSARVTFQGSPSGTTYGNLVNSGAELTETVATAQFCTLDPSKFVGVPHIKVRSGTLSAAVNQDNGATIYLVAKQR